MSLRASIAAALLAAACGTTTFRPQDASPPRLENGTIDPRWWADCTPGTRRCVGTWFQRCDPGAAGELSAYAEQDCAADGRVCDPTLGCVQCLPRARSCTEDTTQVLQCSDDGTTQTPIETCRVADGIACRGGYCVDLCQDASLSNTNIGCEYFAVDLDNAVTGDGQSAASQQFAVVVSNVDQVLTTRVKIEWNTAPVGMPPRLTTVASTALGPMDLEVFKLPAREVDCSAPGTFNTGTGTCLSSQAYRVTSTVPVVAYQFNPLENVGVFSNDASLLLPTNSLGGDYTVLGYPQTIATTSNPNTNFSEDLRSFVTIVGTRAGTRVRVNPSTAIIPGGPIPLGAVRNRAFEVDLGAFDVLNLETGGFQADLSGTTVEALSGAVAVFAGSEAADSPVWPDFQSRQCCADHMEEQLFPRRAIATDYFAPKLPSRSQAVRDAGGRVAVVREEQWYRILNVLEQPVHVETTLPADPDGDPRGERLTFDVSPGRVYTIQSPDSFQMHADGPISVATVTGGQQSTGIGTGLPGGDPSFILLPPMRQWRNDYVFLTPDKYAFDFVTIVARRGVAVSLDDTPLPFSDCPMDRGDACREGVGLPPCPVPDYVVYRCTLSLPLIGTNGNVMPGRQRDGVHIVHAEAGEEGVMVLVSGFDRYVGYGYPAGTRTRSIN